MCAWGVLMPAAVAGVTARIDFVAAADAPWRWAVLGVVALIVSGDVRWAGYALADRLTRGSGGVRGCGCWTFASRSIWSGAACVQITFAAALTAPAIGSTADPSPVLAALIGGALLIEVTGGLRRRLAWRLDSGAW